MNFNIFNSLIVAGIIQGFIFAVVVLTSKKYKARSTLILTSLIVIYSLGNLQYIIPDLGLISLVDMYKYIYLPWAAIIPVIIYFFVVAFVYPLQKFTSEKFLVLPFLVFLIVTLIYRLLFVIRPEVDYFTSFRLWVQGIEIFSILYSLVLVFTVVKTVFHFEKVNKEFNIDFVKSNLSWLKYTLLVILIFTFVWAYLTYRNIFVEDDYPNFYILWLGVAGTIYWLGHVGIYKYGIIQERKKLRKFSLRKDSNSDAHASHNEHIIAFKNLIYKDKLYLDSSLSLSNISEKLGLSASHLSRTIKKELNTNFSEFLNELRVNEAKSYLNNDEFSNYTITAIGLEAGFNSKSSFYEVFKRNTGQTPYAYKKALKA